MPNKNPMYLDAVALDVVSGTSASAAITLNCNAFKITTESLTTAAAAEYTLTMTNNKIGVNSIVIFSVGRGSTTQGTMIAGGATISDGSAVLVMTNTHATEALNGTLSIRGYVFNPKGV
jgi:hypothetical protein